MARTPAGLRFGGAKAGGAADGCAKALQAMASHATAEARASIWISSGWGSQEHISGARAAPPGWRLKQKRPREAGVSGLRAATSGGLDRLGRLGIGLRDVQRDLAL